MDEETRELLKEFKDDNKLAHDEIKILITCLPCEKHSESISNANARLAVIEAQKTNPAIQGNPSKLDWKIVAILGGVITALVYLVEKIVTNGGG